MTIDRLQQRLHGLPRQCAWELLKPIQPWCVDRAVEARGAVALIGQKPEKTAQVSNEVLLRAPPQPPSTQAEEGLDLARVEIPKRRGVHVIREMGEQPACVPCVLRNGALGEPTDVVQMIGIPRQEPLAR